MLHISPSFFAQSPMDRPGYCCFTLGRYSLQNTKNADLQRDTPGQRRQRRRRFHASRHTDQRSGGHTSHMISLKFVSEVKAKTKCDGRRTEDRDLSSTWTQRGRLRSTSELWRSTGSDKFTHPGSDRVWWTRPQLGPWSRPGRGPFPLSDLRWSLGSVGVFPLAAPLSKALGGDVVPHLPVVADLVGFGHVLETLLIPSRQSLEPQRALALHISQMCF